MRPCLWKWIKTISTCSLLQCGKSKIMHLQIAITSAYISDSHQKCYLKLNIINLLQCYQISVFYFQSRKYLKMLFGKFFAFQLSSSSLLLFCFDMNKKKYIDSFNLWTDLLTFIMPYNWFPVQWWCFQKNILKFEFLNCLQNMCPVYSEMHWYNLTFKYQW